MLPSPLEGEGRISTRGTSVRNSGEGCQRHDNILDIGQPINVIPHLLRDLKEKIRSRNKSGMTVVYCHPELVSGSHNCDDMKAPLPTLSPRGRGVVEPRQHIDLSCHCEGERSEAAAIAKSLELNEITTSCATPRNDMCHPEATAEGSQDNPPTLALPLKGGREKLVSEAHRKELNVLTSYRLNCRVYPRGGFNNSRHHRRCSSDDYSDAYRELSEKSDGGEIKTNIFYIIAGTYNGAGRTRGSDNMGFVRYSGR